MSDAMTASRDPLQAGTGAPIIAGHWLRRLALEVATSEARPCAMIGLVASLEGEGTTTILVNLARVLEEDLHRRVVVVDANLAAPGLHLHYGAPLSPGLAEVLRGEVALREAVHMAGSGTFAVLPAGRAQPREQGMLLANARLPGVLDQLKREAFDVCLLDCPAVLGAPEAAIVARHADTSYCVVRAERTARGMVEKAVSRLQAAGCTLGGVVLNRALFHIPHFLYRLL